MGAEIREPRDAGGAPARKQRRNGIAELLDSANEAVALKAASALLERFDGLPEPTPQLVVEYTPLDVMVDRESAEQQAKKARYYRRLV